MILRCLRWKKGEAYFINERKELRDIRDILQRSGGAKVHGTEVFEELDRLDELLKSLVTFFQEIRWIILINDGSVPPSKGWNIREWSGIYGIFGRSIGHAFTTRSIG